MADQWQGWETEGLPEMQAPSEIALENADLGSRGYRMIAQGCRRRVVQAARAQMSEYAAAIRWGSFNQRNGKFLATCLGELAALDARYAATIAITAAEWWFERAEPSRRNPLEFLAEVPEEKAEAA